MIPQIQIHQVFGQIGLRYQQAVWEIHTQQADLSIEAPQAEFDIQYTPGELTIDQTQAFADEGLRTPLAFSEYEAKLAVQTAEQGIADTADWGQRFLHIEKGDALPEWVMRYRDRQRPVEPALVPRPFSVHIHYQLGEVHVHARVQPVHVEAKVHPVEVTFVPGQVHAYLERAPSLRIVTPPVGQLVDTRA